MNEFKGLLRRCLAGLLIHFSLDFAAAGTIVNGRYDFDFWSARIFDQFFRVSVHRTAAVWTKHPNPHYTEMFSLPYRRTLAIQMSSFKNFAVRLTYLWSRSCPLASNTFWTERKFTSQNIETRPNSRRTD